MANKRAGNYLGGGRKKTRGTTKWGLLAIGSQAGEIWWARCEDVEVNMQGEASVLKAANNDVIYTNKRTLENKVYDAKYWCVGAGFEKHPEVNYKDFKELLVQNQQVDLMDR